MALEQIPEFLLFSHDNHHFIIAPFPFITPPELLVSSDHAAHYHILGLMLVVLPLTLTWLGTE
jgi:hypothetical protein